MRSTARPESSESLVGQTATGSGASGAARFLRGVLAVVAAPILIANSNYDSISAGVLVAVFGLGAVGLILELLPISARTARVRASQVLVDAILSLGVAAMANLQATPIVWLALVVPVLTAGLHFGLRWAITVWSCVSLSFAAVTVAFGQAPYDLAEVITLLVQQIAITIAVVGPVLYISRHQEITMRQAERDRHVANERLNDLVDVAGTAVRLARCDEQTAIAEDAIAAMLNTGFERVELWERCEGSWCLVGSGGGAPPGEDVVGALLIAGSEARSVLVMGARELGLENGRRLYASGYQSVAVMHAKAGLTEAVQLVSYSSQADPDRRQVDAIEMLAGHLASAWGKATRVAELDEWARKLAHQATHDPLTNLPNRTGLFEHLNDAGDVGSLILFLDLNGFKAVNDTHGHEAGDAVLNAVAARLVADLEPLGGFVARLGGDEYVVCLPPEAGAPATICRTVIEAIEAPVRFEAVNLNVGTSIGVALAAPGETADSQIRRADEAMYQAKRRKSEGSTWAQAEPPVEAVAALSADQRWRAPTRSGARA